MTAGHGDWTESCVPTIRHLKDQDIPALREMVDRLSTDSIVDRFFTAFRILDDRRLGWLLPRDERDAAFVALVGSRVVGIANGAGYRAEPGVVDVAVVVEDGWQGQGIGRQLVVRTVDHLWRGGARTVRAALLTSNKRALRAIAELAPSNKVSVDEDTALVTVHLPATTPAVAHYLAASR